MSKNPAMGFGKFMNSVDCLIMGRGCMESIPDMNLTLKQWPYGEARIIVLSTTMKWPPENLKNKVEMYSGDLLALAANLKNEGFKHAYTNGGKTIQSFLDLKLIDDMTLTQIPVLLGEGRSLFGKTTQDIRLEKSEATAFPMTTYKFIIKSVTSDYALLSDRSFCGPSLQRARRSGLLLAVSNPLLPIARKTVQRTTLSVADIPLTNKGAFRNDQICYVFTPTSKYDSRGVSRLLDE